MAARAPHRRVGGARVWLGVTAAAVVATAAMGCGKKAPPRPPEPRGPLPPVGVEARQTGPEVFVAFQAPEPRGSNTAQQPTRVELVRVDYAPGVEAPADPDAFRRRGEVVASREGIPLKAGARMSISDPTWRQLADGGVGWTLRYAVRVRDRRGRPSPLVVSPDLMPVPVSAPPRDLSAEPTADGIRLVWRPTTPDGTYRFDVYRAAVGEPFGERPLNGQPLTTPEYLDTTVETGKQYQYEVRTVAGDPPPFRESAGSNAVTLVAEDRFAPSAPQGLVAVQEGDAVRLFWDPAQERDVAGYRVYRRVDASSWERIGPNPVEEPLYLDTDVIPLQRLTYRVSAVDRANPPNESLFPDTVEVVIAEPSPVADPGEREP